MSEKQVNFKELMDAFDFNISDKELIQDNKLHFIVTEQLYRVRMPVQKELVESRDIYHSAKIKLLQKGNVLTEEQLREVLKKNNIDIEKFEADLKDLDSDLIQKSISLAHKRDTEVTTITNLKKEIKEVQDKRYKIAEKIAEHLSSSLENMSKDKQYEYLASVCTEKYIKEEDKGKWIKVWNDINEYGNDDTNLPYIALGHLTRLILTT